MLPDPAGSPGMHLWYWVLLLLVNRKFPMLVFRLTVNVVIPGGLLYNNKQEKSENCGSARREGL